jgi:hypothetical protein
MVIHTFTTYRIDFIWNRLSHDLWGSSIVTFDFLWDMTVHTQGIKKVLFHHPEIDSSE